MAVFDPTRLAKDKVDERAALRRLARLERWAKLILIFETLWPSCVAALSLLGLGLIVILLGGMDLLPPGLRALVIAAVIGGASAIAIRGIFKLHFTREDAIERIDDDTALTHRPALSLADYSAAHLDDPLTFALWTAHRKAVASNAASLIIKWPQPRVAYHDPYALRFAVLLSLIAALLVTGPDGLRRLDTAFMWSASGDTTLQTRIDGWIDPPAYTGLPPILLDFKNPSQKKIIRVPTGASLVLRRSDNAAAMPETTGDLVAQTPNDANEKRFTLTGQATISWQNRPTVIETIPDTPPSIIITGSPQKTQSGHIVLGFRIEDDYGIASGTTRIVNPRRNDKLLLGQEAPLFPPPDQAFMPSGDKRKSDGRVTLDQIESPWAGAVVDFALHVKDDAGQLAKSETFELRLPERRFTIPLAKSLIEERQRLALDPSTVPRVKESLALLALAPELFSIRASDYLALRKIRIGLDQSQNDDDLKAVVELMWSVALEIEEGGSDDAEKALNAAQDALRQALENGASDEDIRALTDRLKQALDAYLKDYAARALKQMNEPGAQTQSRQNGRAIRPEDLQAMLDRMQDMAKNGARDDALRMLDALSAITKNLQAARPRLGDPSQSQDAPSLEGLDKMLRDQRGLRDQTYKDGRSNSEAGQELGQRQEGLRESLDALRDRLKGLDQKGQDALGQAGEAMKRAEDGLRNGDIPGALREQNKALEGLRAGAQALAQHMQRESGEADQPGNEKGSRGDQGGEASETDPLGRENSANGSDDSELNGSDDAGSPGERARNVLNELRKRLSEDERTKDERNYYRRLIGPN